MLPSLLSCLLFYLRRSEVAAASYAIMETTRDEYHKAPGIGRLRVHSHRPHAVVEAVKAYAMENAAEKQQLCLHRLPSMVERVCDLLREPVPQAQDEALVVLRNIRDIMTAVIFMDALDDVELRFRPGLLKEKGLLGCTKGYGASVYIELDPFPQKGFLTRPEVVVPILLHELCHAMLAVFSCENKFCSDGCCHDERDLETGKRYHGTAWQDLAWFVQDLTKAYFGEEMDLRIEHD